MKTFIVALIVLLASAICCQAGDASISWALPKDTRVNQICFYESTVKGGPYTSLPCLSSSLATATVTCDDGVHYFTATFKSATGAESVKSNEISKTVTTPLEVPNIK